MSKTGYCGSTPVLEEQSGATTATTGGDVIGLLVLSLGMSGKARLDSGSPEHRLVSS